jgi:hypothetical protein
LAVYPVLLAPDARALPLIGGASVLVLAFALGLGLMTAVPFAVALLASELVLSLAAQRVDGALTAAIYGAALLVISELAFMSIQLRMPSRAEPGLFRRYLLPTAVVVVASLGIGASAALLASAPVTGGLPLLTAGVAAIFVTIAIVVAITWRSEVRHQ